MSTLEPDILFQEGQRLLREGDRQAAIETFERLLAKAPEHLSTLVVLGAVNFRMGRREAAEALYRRALAIAPLDPSAVHNLAILLSGEGRYSEALAVADAVLSVRPEHGRALVARGNALMGLNRHAAAAESFRAAAENPELAFDALTRLATALRTIGEPDAALQAMDRAVALQPEEPQGRYHRSVLRLLLRDFQGGWQDYEARWQDEGFRKQSLGVVTPALAKELDPAATSANLAGQRILLLGEQGIGDQLMFASMVPDLAEVAAKVTVVCDVRLARLFSASFPEADVRPAGHDGLRRRAFDRIMAMGSLGRLFRNRPEDFPGRPYLRPREEVVGRWAARLGPRNARLRVGVSWRGGTAATGAGARSLELDQLRGVLDLPDCEFVSLQYGDTTAELRQANEGRSNPVRAFPAAEIDDLEELAGLVANLDLVVSVQTALVHLCGGLGVRCLAMLPSSAEWRYTAEGDTMPWYGSVTLFRQPTPGAWPDVVRDVAANVAGQHPGPAWEPPVLPVTALVKRGQAQLAKRDYAAAAKDLEQALSEAPDHLDALVALSAALSALGRLPEAEVCARQALSLRPAHYAAVRNIGVILQDQGRYREALDFADGILKAHPGHAQALFARGNALYQLDRLEEAAEAFEHAATLEETRYEVLTKLGLIYAAMPRFDAALASLDKAIALRPDVPLGYFRRSMIRLLLRDFAGGWQDYEQRWRTNIFTHGSSGAVGPEVIPHLAAPASAAEVVGRRVLLVAEQGVGDEIMFASMLPDLLRDAAAVTLVCEPRLVGLFSASFPGVVVKPPTWIAFDDFDLVLAAGSLGRLYRNAVEDFPGAPYLRPRAEVVAAWADRLGKRRARLRVGISWRGGGVGTRRHSRSLTLDQLQPLLDLPDCEFVNLQYGEVAAELEAFNRGRANPIRVFPRADIDDFEELAGLVSNLDLVVSVQTALVHLSGAIGQTCLTLIPQNPEWRYAAEGSDMPWYDTVRLFRQSQAGDWAPVVREVADEVRRRLG